MPSVCSLKWWMSDCSHSDDAEIFQMQKTCLPASHVLPMLGAGVRAVPRLASAAGRGTSSHLHRLLGLLPRRRHNLPVVDAHRARGHLVQALRQGRRTHEQPRERSSTTRSPPPAGSAPTCMMMRRHSRISCVRHR